MLSPFLKKLMFARQFSMSGGVIDVLGSKHAMLPMDVILSLHEIDPSKSYGAVKKGVQKSLESYGNRIGSNSEGLLKISGDIFALFGIGNIEIVSLDNAKCGALVRVVSPPKEGGRELVAAALAGTFSFVFKKDVNCHIKRQEHSSALFEVAPR